MKIKMDQKKYEQLTESLDDPEQFKAIFHDIVVESSRQIYESLMDEEMDEGMHGQVADLMDEIDAEETGMMEDEEEDEEDMDMDDEEDMDMDDEEDEEDMDIDFEDDEVDMEMDSEDENEELEDRVVQIEDKLDELMAEFEAIMASDEGDEVEMDSEEEVDMDMDSEDEEAMMEAVQLQKVSVTHGDNGVQTKSPVAANSGKAGMDSKPVNFGSGEEKGRSAPQTKDLEGAGKFKNSPGHKSQDLDKAPAPKKAQDSGVNTKSPVSESKKTTKKIVK
jgi:hypothetical protein